jgi:hypothetical protein
MTTQDLADADLTQAVVESFGGEPRLREVLRSLVRHLHAFAGEVQLTESGCVLVRPDCHVAWRSRELVDDPAGELARVLGQVLGLVALDEPAPAVGAAATAAG